ncbi:hypothetical protein BDV59DRAFT_172176, partial [Aspergillus ambiguus]|uniref:uncharacterized protein n=1 Tax=Aspergillus ambiguus TaxID=176160 RepID=UPI003CCDC256
MSDVRSLLRSELASRKGSSSSTRSAPNRVTKKRKVDNGDDLTRKKVRHVMAAADQQLSSSPAIQPPSAQALDEEGDQELEVESTPQEAPSESVNLQENVSAGGEPPVPQATQAIDEDEWAAFERDVVAPTRVPQAVAAAATISAAPMTAEEIAAQQEKDNQSMVRAREAEAEGEREDAARFLEDEFDEMEQLEERVRRLKQKREELRTKRALEDAETGPVNDQDDRAKANKEGEEDDDDDDDGDDDWDNWRF